MSIANGIEGVRVIIKGEERDGLTVHHSRMRDRGHSNRDLFFGAIKGASDILDAPGNPLDIEIRYPDGGMVVEVEGAYFDSEGHFGARSIVIDGVAP